jgi:hypothetical protein
MMARSGVNGSITRWAAAGPGIGNAGLVVFVRAGTHAELIE